jgi:ATP phosphoribosyltransferase
MSRLRLAVPNKGRMMEPSLALLRDAGVAFERTERTLSVQARNTPLEILFVRTDDIAEMVADEVADLGIAGLDLLCESGFELRIVAELGFGRCRLAAAVPKDGTQSTLEDLDGLRVATAHPRTTARLLRQRGVTVIPVPLHGSVEVAPKLGVADAIVDLVSTGSTMLVNGLRPIGTLLESQAVLLARPGENGEVERVATMLDAVVAARSRRYLMMNAPRAATERVVGLIPGLASPTVIPLADRDMVAIHSVVEADDVWHLLPELEAAGGSGILVMPINQLIP